MQATQLAVISDIFQIHYKEHPVQDKRYQWPLPIHNYLNLTFRIFLRNHKDLSLSALYFQNPGIKSDYHRYSTHQKISHTPKCSLKMTFDIPAYWYRFLLPLYPPENILRYWIPQKRYSHYHDRKVHPIQYFPVFCSSGHKQCQYLSLWLWHRKQYLDSSPVYKLHLKAVSNNFPEKLHFLPLPHYSNTDNKHSTLRWSLKNIFPNLLLIQRYQKHSLHQWINILLHQFLRYNNPSLSEPSSANHLSGNTILPSYFLLK